MLDPTNNLVPILSSPTISSISSSDLDTESTGSFFHDRSTTLGTLMGVSFPVITLRAPSQHSDPRSISHPSTTTTCARRKAHPRNRANAMTVVAERRRRWWQLCREGEARPASLGEFLEVERRFGDGGFYGTAAELENMVVGHHPRNHNERVLFDDGKVLPPDDDGESTAGNLWKRFPVSICSGGVG